MKFHITDADGNRKHPMQETRLTGSGNVVAWLTPLDSFTPPGPATGPTPVYRLVQKDKQFAPHLLVVRTGSSIDFPNEDPFFHNVFSLFNGKRFDLGLYEAGNDRAVRFDREGVSYIFCNIHPQMGAVVVALNTPYYAISSSDGSLTITNVRPGDYMLTMWAEGVPTSNLAAAGRKVTVSQGMLTLGLISLTRPSSSQTHSNKFGEDYKPTSDKAY